MRIRAIDTPSEFQQCVDLQRLVWRFERPDLVIAPMLAASREAGGIVLGAFERGELIGFVFSLPAPREGGIIQHSHMLAVLPAFRDRGIGYRLKIEQYRQAARQGNDWITWTFEPLESKNAHLNLNRLGVTAGRYYVNLYGETSSELHAGLGTDRLLAEWAVSPDGVALPPLPSRERPEHLPAAVLSAARGGWREPVGTELNLDASVLTAEIPAEIQALKKADPALATAWRVSTRAVFLHYLKRGYRIDALLSCRDEGDKRRSFYRLSRK